jgi:hypothetical protein
MDGQVGLRPATLPAQLADSLSESEANIFSCHPSSFAVFFGQHSAYRIQTCIALFGL